MQYILEIFIDCIFHMIGGFIRWVVSGRKIPYKKFLIEKEIVIFDATIGLIFIVLIVYAIHRLV